VDPLPLPLLVLGTSSFPVEVAEVASDAGFRVVGFVENERRERCTELLEGLPIYWVDDLRELAPKHVVICGLGTTFRTRFTDQASALGAAFAIVVHPSSHVPASVELGEGSVVGVGVIVGAHTKIGRHVAINRGALIGHHASIGDHATIGPGANVAGNTAIGEATYVSMGAIVINGLRVGAHSVIAAGAVVIEDLPDHVLAVGVPAKIVKEGIIGK
jgi:acetyltransferase EpsM